MDQLWDRTGYGTLISTGAGDNFVHSPAGGILRDNDSWLHGDAVGSVRYTTDPTGAVNGAAAFGVFGEPRSAGNSQFGFAGEQTDPTGLVHLRARGYNPTLGTFTAFDPVQPGGPSTAGWNRYTYSANNPTTWSDPSGEVTVTERAFLQAALVTLAAAAIYYSFQAFADIGDLLEERAASPASTGSSTGTYNDINDAVDGSAGTTTGQVITPSQTEIDATFWEIVGESLRPDASPEPRPTVVPPAPDSFGLDCNAMPRVDDREDLRSVAEDINGRWNRRPLFGQTVAALSICIDTPRGPVGGVVVGGQPGLVDQQTSHTTGLGRVVAAPELPGYAHAEEKVVGFARILPDAHLDAIYSTNNFCPACQQFLAGAGFAVEPLDLRYAVHGGR